MSRRRFYTYTTVAWLAALGAVVVLADQNLDLPVHPSTHTTEAPAPLPADPPGDDPRDEPPPVFYGEEIAAEGNVIIYVIDVSASMRSSSRMDKAKAELARSIQGLSPAFRFNVIAYSCVIYTAFPGLVRADDGNKRVALRWVDALYPHSGTATGPGVSLALAERSCLSVVLLTDGAPNCGAQDDAGHRSMIRNNNTQGATINVFGIAASGTLRDFCTSVAADSGGSYIDVP